MKHVSPELPLCRIVFSGSDFFMLPQMWCSAYFFPMKVVLLLFSVLLSSFYLLRLSVQFLVLAQAGGASTPHDTFSHVSRSKRFRREILPRRTIRHISLASWRCGPLAGQPRQGNVFGAVEEGKCRCYHIGQNMPPGCCLRQIVDKCI